MKTDSLAGVQSKVIFQNLTINKTLLGKVLDTLLKLKN